MERLENKEQQVHPAENKYLKSWKFNTVKMFTEKGSGKIKRQPG